MKMLLNEAVDVASRKRATQFLIDNYDKCFPNNPNATPEQKQQDAKRYIDEVLIQFCHPIDVLARLSWTKALVEGLVRILKTECNDGTNKPVNNRMKSELKKLYFIATMYRQKQQWDGLPQNRWLTTNLNGWSFYRLRTIMLPFYEEAKEIHENGYGDKFLGKKKMLENAANANKDRAEEIKRRLDAGEEVSDADREWYKAYLKDQENDQAAAVPRDADPWENADWNGHKPYMDGKFRIGDKGYWAVRIDNHKQSKTWCWWTYPNCPWDQEHNGAQWCITYDDEYYWNAYHLGGRGQVTYYVFKEGFEKLDRTEDGNVAREPYDTWGTSMICVRLSRDPRPDDSHVEGFCSRYNHFGQEGYDVAHKDGFADNFCNRGEIDRFCQLVGCTKEEFCAKFKYTTQANRNGLDISNLYSRLDGGNFDNLQGSYILVPLKDEEKTYTNFIIKDTTNSKYNYIVNNRLVLEQWCNLIGRAHDAFNNLIPDYIIASCQGKEQFYDKYGNAILPTPIPSNAYKKGWFVKNPATDHTYLVLNVDFGGNYTMLYDVTAKRYATVKPIPGFYDPIDNSFPYFTKDEHVYVFDLKTSTIKQFDLPEGCRADYKSNRFNKSFIINTNSRTIITKSNMQKHNVDLLSFYNNEVAGNPRKWILPDGTEKTFEEVFGKPYNDEDYINNYGIITDGNKSIIGVISTKSVRIARPNGEVLLNLDAGDEYSRFSINNRKYYSIIFAYKENIGKKMFLVSPHGVSAIEYDNGFGTTYIKIDNQIHAYYITYHNLYNDKGEVILKSEEFNLEFVGLHRDSPSISNTPTVELRLSNGDCYIVWVKTGKYVKMPSYSAPLGYGYLFCKTGNDAAVYDDEGRKVLAGSFKLNNPFNSDGIASIKRGQRTIFFNLDNEWSESLEELAESKKSGKVKLLTETKQVESPIDRFMKLAAYFC